MLNQNQVLVCRREGKIGISPFHEENLKLGAYTFTLGPRLRKIKSKFIDARSEKVEYEEITMGEEGYELQPGEFALLETAETVFLGSGLTCMLSTRPTIAQMGLDVMQGSSLCLPGKETKFVLETTNAGPARVRIYAGVRIAKGVFFANL
ncbi:MAG: hypothetical protein WCJ29_05135 [bacterium]